MSGLSRTEVGGSREVDSRYHDRYHGLRAEVKLSSFGTFMVRSKSGRIGRNPKTGEEVPITPRRVLVFRPSQVMKNIDQRSASGRGRRSGMNFNAGTCSRSRKEMHFDRKRLLKLSHDQRSRRSPPCAPACAALLGDAVLSDQADEARRRAALLPPAAMSICSRASVIFSTARATRSAACSAS